MVATDQSDDVVVEVPRDDEAVDIGKPAMKRLPRHVRYPPVDEETILRWAMEHRERTGTWPHVKSGVIVGGIGDNWAAIDQCLAHGLRGLTKGQSIHKLLMARVPGYKRAQGPGLSIDQILAWADAHYARTGAYPIYTSGAVAEAPKQRWAAINTALLVGARGLPPGLNLARLLLERRGVRNRVNLESITTVQILHWADAYHARNGRWPKRTSGVLQEKPELTWELINNSLIQGSRGLPGGPSLASLLNAERGVRNHLTVPRLTYDLILEWADDFHGRRGRWPNMNSGDIPEAPGETWHNVQNALYSGLRGLPPGSSVARLLSERRGVRNTVALPIVSVEQILAWADEYHASTGHWPHSDAGAIPNSGGEMWCNIDSALLKGTRGLPTSSLARLLAESRNRPYNRRKSPLALDQVMAWADAYHAVTGRWPSVHSGVVKGGDGETWNGLNCALINGLRGLPAGESLPKLFARLRGARNRADLTPLTEVMILQWARAHLARTGEWPTQKSGPVHGQPGEKWNAINSSLYLGSRSLPGWSSLAVLLDTIRDPKRRPITRGDEGRSRKKPRT